MGKSNLRIGTPEAKPIADGIMNVREIVPPDLT